MSTICEAPRGSGRKTERGIEHTRTFTVICDSAEEGYTLLAATPWFIYRGVSYVDEQNNTPDPYCVCLGITHKAMVSPTTGVDGLYEFVARYGYNTIRYEPPPPAQAYGAKWRVEKTESWEPTDIDGNGEVIANKVGEPIEPTLTRHTTSRVLVGEWLQRFGTRTEADTYGDPYEDRVNSEAFHGAPPKCYLCLSVRAEEANIPGDPLQGIFDLYRMTARFLYRQPHKVGSQEVAGWVPGCVHRGYRRKITPTAMEELRDDNDTPRARAMYLSADGTTEVTPEQKVYLTFPDFYKTANMNLLVPQ